MKLPGHVALSLSVACGVYGLYRSIAMAVATFLSGILVDLDHLFDYLREYGLRIDARFFFHSFHHTLYHRVVLPLHAWEWLAVPVALSALSLGSPVSIGFFIGMGSHLVADQCTTGVGSWGYFITYRAWKGFYTRSIFPGKGLW